MDEFLTVPEVAEQLQRKPGTIRRWIHQGQIDAHKLPSSGKLHHYRIKKTVVEALEQQRKHLVWWENDTLDQTTGNRKKSQTIP
jgi:excisionase family DNA binding protein